MEQYKVAITKEALQDMEDIYDYIAVELLSPKKKNGIKKSVKDAKLSAL